MSQKWILIKIEIVEGISNDQVEFNEGKEEKD